MKRRTIRIALHIAFWFMIVIWFMGSAIEKPAEWVLYEIVDKINEMG